MKRVLFLSVFLLTLFSCENKKGNYSEELQKIFDTYGGIDAWKNIKSVSFKVDKETFTTDLVSGKKVVNAPNYSLGFNGKNYWISSGCPIQNPKKYIEEISNAFFIPFSLADVKQTDDDKDSTVLYFNETKVFYNPDFFTIDAVDYPNTKISYQNWQENVGFTLPKKVKINKIPIEFTNIQLSQVVFDDRFYQKP